MGSRRKREQREIAAFLGLLEQNAKERKRMEARPLGGLFEGSDEDFNDENGIEND